MKSNVKDDIITARVKLLFQQPFFGNIATRMKVEENHSFVKTAATDGRTLWYNDEFFSKMNINNIVFVVAHEILHMVFNHMGRTDYRDHKLFNIACDYAVNGILIRDKIGIPPDVNYYHDTQYNGMSAEEIYDILEKDAIKIPAGTLIDDHIDWGGSGNGDDGNDDQQQDSSRPKYTASELEDLRNEIIGNIIQAYQASAGKIPGEIERMIRDLTEPKMNWRQVLRNTIQSLVKNDFSWLRPSRKGWHLNAILPGVNYDETIDVAFCIDMSGSISDEQATTTLSEVKGLMDEYADFNLHLWSFDTKVYNHKIFTKDNADEIMEYKPMGGGGTDFVVNWEFMKENGILPKRFIMFTDGYCDHRGFGDPEYCDTLFIMLDSKIVAPFGDTVHYDD